MHEISMLEIRYQLLLACIKAVATSATISLAFSVAPMLTIAVATCILGLLDRSVIFDAELVIDWKMAGRKLWETDTTTK